MSKQFVVPIAILIILCGVLTGCQSNKPIQNEPVEVKTSATELPQDDKQEKDTLKPPPQSEKITASYWLGEAGEQIKEYVITSLPDGRKAISNAGGNCILTGFEEFDLMLNLIFAKKDGLWGLYDQTGTKIIEHHYEEISNYEMPDGHKANGLVGVKKDGLWGAIDQDGNIVIQPEFEYIELNYYEEVEPFIKVEKNGKYGYVTYEGQPLVDPVWDTAFMDVLNVPEDIIFVKQGDRWGGIRVEDNKAALVDWNLKPSEEAQLSFNSWQYAYQHDFYVHQVMEGRTAITPSAKIFFNDYFRKNPREICSLPVFARGESPGWEELTKFVYEKAACTSGVTSVSTEIFEAIVKKYFGEIDYSHKNSSYLTYNDGNYTAIGWSDHGFYIYELKGLEKGITAEGKDSWKARITGYYFYELDGDPNETFFSDNARAVYEEMKKEEYNGLNFWQACDRLVWNNPGAFLEPACEWLIEFTVNDPRDDLYFTYLTSERKEYYQ